MGLPSHLDIHDVGKPFDRLPSYIGQYATSSASASVKALNSSATIGLRTFQPYVQAKQLLSMSPSGLRSPTRATLPPPESKAGTTAGPGSPGEPPAQPRRAISPQAEPSSPFVEAVPPAIPFPEEPSPGAALPAPESNPAAENAADEAGPPAPVTEAGVEES
jgi:hypothetical protein